MDGQHNDPHMDDWPGGEDCEQALRTLYYFLDGELTPDRRVAIERHLNECSPCLEAFDFEAELKIVIARSCRDQVPEGLRQRIADALHQAAVPSESPGWHVEAG
jgi:mycothiol system anti-sigma-R factor